MLNKPILAYYTKNYSMLENCEGERRSVS